MNFNSENYKTRVHTIEYQNYIKVRDSNWTNTSDIRFNIEEKTYKDVIPTKALTSMYLQLLTNKKNIYFMMEINPFDLHPNTYTNIKNTNTVYLCKFTIKRTENHIKMCLEKANKDLKKFSLNGAFEYINDKYFKYILKEPVEYIKPTYMDYLWTNSQAMTTQNI